MKAVVKLATSPVDLLSPEGITYLPVYPLSSLLPVENITHTSDAAGDAILP